MSGQTCRVTYRMELPAILEEALDNLEDYAKLPDRRSDDDYKTICRDSLCFLVGVRSLGHVSHLAHASACPTHKGFERVPYKTISAAEWFKAHREFGLVMPNKDYTILSDKTVLDAHARYVEEVEEMLKAPWAESAQRPPPWEEEYEMDGEREASMDEDSKEVDYAAMQEEHIMEEAGELLEGWRQLAEVPVTVAVG